MFLALAPSSLGLSAYGLQQQRLWLLLVAPLLMVPFTLLFPTVWGVPFVPFLQLALTWCVHRRWHRSDRFSATSPLKLRQPWTGRRIALSAASTILSAARRVARADAYGHACAPTALAQC